jgi:GNAT superfamily N-acetyltransferase
MPIVVEFLKSVTYQDQGDLQKIYRDAPPWLFTPFSDASQLIESGLDHSALIAARFNDRLLGAAYLHKHQDAWELSHLCVRALTRRRGVAERLVIQAQKSAMDAGCTLRLLTTVESPEVRTLAAKLHVPLEISPVTAPGKSRA